MNNDQAGSLFLFFNPDIIFSLLFYIIFGVLAFACCRRPKIDRDEIILIRKIDRSRMASFYWFWYYWCYDFSVSNFCAAWTSVIANFALWPILLMIDWIVMPIIEKSIK